MIISGNKQQRKKPKYPFETQTLLQEDRKMNKLVLVFTFSVCFSILILFYANDSFEAISQIFNIEANQNPEFSLESTSCNILDLDPFDPQVKPFHKLEEYVNCTKKELLTYITKKNNIATLHINVKVLPYYGTNVSCCYQKFSRPAIAKCRLPDQRITQDSCVDFENNVTLHLKKDFVRVECKNLERKKVYNNIHAPIIITEKVAEKLQSMDEERAAFSVLIVAIDSVSRLNFIRSLPNSYKFLTDNEWISFKAYNKIDDNTYPNVMAILTGNNQDDRRKQCNCNVLKGLDECPMLWYDFRNLGYVTAYAEDETSLSTFNLDKKGFKDPPTDYYFRPYFLVSELALGRTKIANMSYCTGPETSGERVLNVAKDFASTFVNSSNFGLFWMNTFSHNSINTVSMMDDKIRQFLQDISNAGVLENSLVFFLSDHGPRWGKFRQTLMGWLEERLPFFFMWVPHRFIRKFPNEYSILKSNSRKLTNPYDVYMTLQHLLVMSGLNYVTKQSYDCPKCKSLFSEIERNRSCTDAGIAPEWCTCTEFAPRSKIDPFIKKAARAMIDGIHKAILAHKEGFHCAKYSLKKIINARISDSNYILITIETLPQAVFESLIAYKSTDLETFEVNPKGISRIDKYSEHSFCVNFTALAKFCYCKT